MRIKQIIRLFDQGETIKAIRRSCGVSRNSIRFYLRRLKELGISFSEALEMDNPLLQEKIFSHIQEESLRQELLHSKAEFFAQELKRKGVTRQLLWEEYRKENPQGYGYSQFCYYLQQHKRVREAVMVQQHPPGEQFEVDFTGVKLKYADKATGEIVPCEVFVAVLSNSNYTFIKAIHDQKLENVIGGCVSALEYFGGSPKVIVPDNFRTAVTQSNRYEPRINDVFLDMANYYGMAVIPARPYKPRDKPRVERGVNLVYQRIFAPLRNKTFGSLHELNLALAQENEKFNDRRMPQFDCSRRQLFEQNEKPLLQPLPAEPYELHQYLELTVQCNCYIYISRSRQYFSVPFRLIGQKVKVVRTESSVVIYYKGDRIATHPVDVNKKYNDIPDHLPSHHKHYLASKNQTEILQHAENLGPEVKMVVEMVLKRGIHPEQNYKTCQGIFSLARKISAATLREACRIAMEFGVVTYRDIQRIATGQYANRNPKPASSSLPDHENIRGKTLFD